MQNVLVVVATLSTLTLPSACTSARAADTVGAVSAEQSGGPFLYVANQENASVSVIDLETNTVVQTVDLTSLGFPANSKPHHTAVERDGAHWYVSLIAAGKVLKFTRDNELVGQADFETPGMLALHPTENLLYVGRSMAAVNPPQRIGVIDPSTMDIEEIDVFFGRPHALAVDPRGGWIYSGSLASNQIASIDVASGDLELTTLEGDTHVFVQFAVSPDGRWLVATGELTSKLLVFDSSNPQQLRLVHQLDVNHMPWHPAFSPDGRWVWFGNQMANTVTVVDAESWRVTDVIRGDGLAEPHGLAFAPDGNHVYVSNRNVKGEYAPGRRPVASENRGNVVVIDAHRHTIERVIEVGRYAAGMSTQPAR